MIVLEQQTGMIVKRVTISSVMPDITVREVARDKRTDSNVMRTDVPLEVEQDVLHVFLNHQEHQVRHALLVIQVISFKTRLATRTVVREGIVLRVLNRVRERLLRHVLHVQMVTISVEHNVFLTDVVLHHRETDVRLVLIRQNVQVTERVHLVMLGTI